MYSLRNRDLSSFLDGEEAGLAAKAEPWTRLSQDVAASPETVNAYVIHEVEASPGFAEKLANIAGTYSPIAVRLMRKGKLDSARGRSSHTRVSSPQSQRPHGERALRYIANQNTISALKTTGMQTQDVHFAPEFQHVQKENEDLRNANDQLKQRLDAKTTEVCKLHERIRKLEKQISQQGASKDSGLPTAKHCKMPCCIPHDRLERAGLNVEPFSELGAMWAGYVYSLLAGQVKASGNTLAEVFRKYKDHLGQMNESAFRNLVSNLLPSFEDGRLTRLFYYADTDGSGSLNFLEFLRLFGLDLNGRMGEEYFEHVMVRIQRGISKHGGFLRVLGSDDRFFNGFIARLKLVALLANLGTSLTRSEIFEACSRFVSVGNDAVQLRDFNEALILRASAGFVTEEWVKKLFRQVATSIQKKPLNLRQMIKNMSEHGWVGRADIYSFLRSFQPTLKDEQLDQVFGYVCSKSYTGCVSGRVDASQLIQVICRDALGPSQPSADTSKENCHLPAEAAERLALQLEKLCGGLAKSFDQLNPCLCFNEFCVALQALGFGSSIDFEYIFNVLDVHRNGRVSKATFLACLSRHVEKSREQYPRGSNVDIDHLALELVSEGMSEPSAPLLSPKATRRVSSKESKSNPNEVARPKNVSLEMESRLQYFRESFQQRRMSGKERWVPISRHVELMEDLQRAVNRLLILETDVEQLRRREELREAERRGFRSLTTEGSRSGLQSSTSRKVGFNEA